MSPASITSAENVATISDAQHSRDALSRDFERIAQEGLHANVSSKLTQLGLDIKYRVLRRLAFAPSSNAPPASIIFCALTWKVLPYTQRTIDLVKRVRARNPAVGTVIQSYLYRSETDVTDLLSYGCRIRLCKGAYKEISGRRPIREKRMWTPISSG